MAEETKGQIQMRDFPGLILDQDANDIAAGAGRKQVNLIPFAGQLIARKGPRELSFETVIDAT
jgi:hypothetical protein